MSTNKLDYIDFKEVNTLLEGFNKTTGFVTAILDLNGNVLSKSGWRQICTEFHRINPETTKNCSFSDTILASNLGKEEKYHFYECLNGLVDVAVPIIIKGEHIANLFSGQFFFNEPDRDFFLKQAQKYGFNESEYLKALGDIPIVSKEKVKIAMGFLLNMTQLISEITLQKLEQSELNEALRESEKALREKEEKYRLIADNSDDWIYWIATDGFVHYVSPACERVTGYLPEEFVNNRYLNQEIIYADDLDKVNHHTQTSGLDDTPHNLEFRIVTKDGEIRWISHNCSPVFGNNGDYAGRRATNRNITESKRQEVKITQLNERISTATRATKVGIWDWDVKNNVLVWDDQMYSLYGLKNTESEGAFETWVNGLYPDDREFSQNETRLALADQKEYDTEFRVVWPDGTIRFIKARGEIFRDETGDPVRMVGINYDITEQKKTEEKIRQKDQEFKKLSANVPDLIFQFTRRADGSYFVPIASEGIRNIFGCSPEDVLNDFGPIGRVIYPEDAERVIRDIEYSAEHLTYFTCEFRVQIPGREIQWIYSNSTPERLPDGIVTWYGFNVDITHKKMAEEAIHESEKKFRLLTESIPLPVTYVNKTGEIIFRNDRFLQVIGYTEIEVPTIEEWWFSAYPDEKYRQWVIQNWTSLVKRASEKHTDIEAEEYRVKCKDGSERTFIVSGIIIDDNLLIIFIDITDRKKAVDEIRKLNESLEERVEERTSQLQEVNNELEAFSYSVSHDLRAPLRHINGFAEILTKQYSAQLPEDAKKHLNTITGSAKKMGTLIDDLLSFSRTGRTELKKSKLRMDKVIEDALAQIKLSLKDRQIDWDISSLPEVRGDYNLLRMVWINLLDNAVKYTNTREKAVIQIGWKDEKSEKVFFIKDNGVGFDMKYADKLFGVFQRLHASSQFDGTGIGLANVKRIILRHGGRTWAESKIDKGAIFYFSIPKEMEDSR